MSRLEILKNSLAKKEKRLAEVLEKQKQTIVHQKEEIDKTKRAIAREEAKEHGTGYIYSLMPGYLKNMIDDGTLKQCQRHPHILSVSGVEGAKLYFNEKTGIVSRRYASKIQGKEQFLEFWRVFRELDTLQNDSH